MKNRRNQGHNNESEVLFFEGSVEVRSSTDGKKTIFGYWAKYNQRSREMRTSRGVRFIETILPGAFDRTDFSDVESRFNHEELLSTVPNLKYGFDDVGAWYEIPVDEQDPVHLTTLRKIIRGDSKGSSFDFSGPSPSDQIVTDEGGIKLRSIKHFPKIHEFGPVVHPAYPQTTSFVRDLDSQDEIDLLAQQAFQESKLSAIRFLNCALS